MRIFGTRFLALALLSFSGCVHERWLVPAPNAALVPGASGVAEASISGVRVTVAGNAWHGSPQDLDAVIAPLQVHIENHSGKPIRVRYSDFALVGASGFRYAALSPLNLQDGRSSNDSHVEPMAGAALRFELEPSFWYGNEWWWGPRFAHRPYLAPGWRAYYPGWPYWHYPWPYDPFYYDGHYSWPISLPTADMIAMALPEGSVDNNGKVSGFLYFRGVNRREPQATFEMQVTDASSGESMGTLSIPLVVSHFAG